MNSSLNTSYHGSRWPNLVSLSVVSMMALLVFSGCSNAPRTLDVNATPIEVPAPPTRPPVVIPAPLDLVPVTFNVVTPDRMPEGDWVFIALHPRQYENLARNHAEILRWVREASTSLQQCSRPP